MATKMEMLEELYMLSKKYTKTAVRPSFIDLWVYDTIIGMYESDYENGSTVPDYLWRKKPDEIMELYLKSDKMIFDLEYGVEAFDESVREYLIKNEFIVNVEDVSDEEYQSNLEGK